MATKTTSTLLAAGLTVALAISGLATAANATAKSDDDATDLLARLGEAREAAESALPPLVTAHAFTTNPHYLDSDELFDVTDIADDPHAFAERFPESTIEGVTSLATAEPGAEWGNCDENDDGYHSKTYGGSYVDAYSYLRVTWNGNSVYGCADSTHPSDSKYWHEGNGRVRWMGSSPYNADEVAIGVHVKAPGWGVESISISASDVGLTLTSSSNDNKLFEGTKFDIWYWSFSYDNEYVDLGSAGQVWNIEQKVSGTFTFEYSGGIVETVSTSTYASVDV